MNFSYLGPAAETWRRDYWSSPDLALHHFAMGNLSPTTTIYIQPAKCYYVKPNLETAYNKSQVVITGCTDKIFQSNVMYLL